MSDKPVIPVGDVVRQFNIPGWLRWLLNLVKGAKIHAGPVDIQLDQGQGATPPKTGLDQPAKFEPPKMGGPR